MSELANIHIQTKKYCPDARKLIKNPADQALRDLAKHILDCVVCLQAQYSEEESMAADSIRNALEKKYPSRKT